MGYWDIKFSATRLQMGTLHSNFLRFQGAGVDDFCQYTTKIQPHSSIEGLKVRGPVPPFPLNQSQVL